MNYNTNGNMYSAEIYRLKHAAEKTPLRNHFIVQKKMSGQTRMGNVESGHNNATMCLNFDIQSASNEALMKDRDITIRASSKMRSITSRTLTSVEAPLTYDDMDKIVGTPSIDKMYEKSPNMHSTITDSSSNGSSFFSYPEHPLRNDARKRQTNQSLNLTSAWLKPFRNTSFEMKVKSTRGSAFSSEGGSFAHTDESKQQSSSQPSPVPTGSKRRNSSNNVSCCSHLDVQVSNEILSKPSMDTSCQRARMEKSSDDSNENRTSRNYSNESKVRKVAVNRDNICREQIGGIDDVSSLKQRNMYCDSAFHVADNNCQVNGGNGDYLIQHQRKPTPKPIENEPMDQLAMEQLIARLKEEIPPPKRQPMPMVTTRCNDIGQHVQCLNIEAFLLRLFDHYEDAPELLAKLANHDDINFVVSKIREGGNIPNHMNVCVDLLVSRLMTTHGDCQDLILYIYSKLLYIFVIFERDYKTAWHLCEAFLLFYPHGCGIRSLDGLFRGAEAVLQMCASDNNAVTVSLDGLLGRGSNKQMCSLLQTILRM